MDVQGWICSGLGGWTFTVGRLGLEVHSCEIHSVGVEVHQLEVQVRIFSSPSSFLVVFFRLLVLFYDVFQCLVGDWFSTKICRERCGSKYYVVHVLHRCSGLAISEMSTSTGSSGQGCASPTLETVVIGRVHPNEARNVRESRTPNDDAVAHQAHVDMLEKAIEILGEESPQAQGLIAALKQVRDRAVVPPIGVQMDSCQAFVERARRRVTAAEELPRHSAREVHENSSSSKRWRGCASARRAASREREVPARATDLSATIPATAAEEVNLLRATIEELRRAQVSLMAQLSPTDKDSTSNRQAGWMETLIDDRCRCVRFPAISVQELSTVNRTLSCQSPKFIEFRKGVQKLGNRSSSPSNCIRYATKSSVGGGFRMDEFDLRTVFQCRAVVMRTVPPILRGPFRNALRIAMDEAIGGIEVFDELRQERAWKLFLLLPRMSAPRTRWIGAMIQN